MAEALRTDQSGDARTDAVARSVTLQSLDAQAALLPYALAFFGVSLRPAKSNGCKPGGLEWDLLPVDFLRQIH